MKTFAAMVPASLLVFAVISGNCGADQGFSVKMDTALNREDQATLRNDIRKLKGYRLSAEHHSYFDFAFSGVGSAGVLSYLDERVNYIVPFLENPLSRVKQGGRPVPVEGKSSQEKRDNRTVTMASNIGISLWLLKLANPTSLSTTFTVGNEDVPLSSSRVGIIELGPGYSMKKTPNGTPITSSIRTTTLVHEARHSDCTGGILVSDWLRLLNHEFPEDLHCGHRHIQCPTGHPLSGLFACDDHAWGAYSIEAVFSETLNRTCSNCDELEKQQALMGTLDAFSRVLVLDDMLNGKLGVPNMSSSDW